VTKDVSTDSTASLPSWITSGIIALNIYYVLFKNHYLFVILDRICGRINFVPAFQWYVEDQQPEVTINLRHVGLDDGYSEGLAFTLSGGSMSSTFIIAYLITIISMCCHLEN
jgi:hypothetical protein